MNAPVRIIKANEFDAAFDRCIDRLNALRPRFYASCQIWEGRKEEITCAEDTLEHLPMVADACFELMATLGVHAEEYIGSDHMTGFIGYMLEEMDNTFIDPMKAEITKEWEAL